MYFQFNNNNMYFGNNKKSLSVKLKKPKPCPYHSRIKTQHSEKG